MIILGPLLEASATHGVSVGPMLPVCACQEVGELKLREGFLMKPQSLEARTANRQTPRLWRTGLRGHSALWGRRKGKTKLSYQ